ncbi:MAG: hypothetical protein B6I28_01590 [Fusobacteriia bacterium 4572_132]|nr:MAG: hypothetical protein B6I28_01590 [Fusobacteriia bacterium 4572_132]
MIKKGDEVVKLEEINLENKEEILEVKSIELEAFKEGGSDEWVILPIARCGKILLLKDEENILGSVEILRKWGKNDIYIFSFALKLKYCGKGFGTKLMELLLEYLKKENIENIYLTVDPENKIAVGLYEKFGFKKDRFLKDEYGKGIDRIYMKLKLEN